MWQCEVVGCSARNDRRQSWVVVVVVEQSVVEASARKQTYFRENATYDVRKMVACIVAMRAVASKRYLLDGRSIRCLPQEVPLPYLRLKN